MKGMNVEEDAQIAYPGREPRPDTEASDAYGDAVEELGKIRTAMPWSSRGPHLAMETLEFMALYASRRRLGRFEASQNPGHVDSLVAADLMEEDGSWNAAGLFLTDAFRNTRASIEVDGGHGPTRSRLDIKVGNQTALAMAGPGSPDVLGGIGMSTGHRQLDIVGVEGVPALIAQWVGLGPAWSVGNAVEMDGTDFSQILQGPGPIACRSEPPAGFERFWDEPWFEWSVRMVTPHRSGHQASAADAAPFDVPSSSGQGIELRFVNAGRAGHFHYAFKGGTALLTPAPTFSVWMDLLRAYDAVLSGQAQPQEVEGGW